MKKALDQTVRELKREVNKKVLKVPGIEQKILDATSNEPWGPHGSLLADIAQATRNYHEYQIIMHVIWKRLNDTGKNWRHVYKALTVLEYMVGHGSERVIDEIREHAYQISTLSDFQYIDSSGKDQGNNVRRKSQILVSLVNDKEKVQEVRQKALANKDKYRATFSSSGSYRPSSNSFGSSYGDRYDDDRYENRSGNRDDDRNGYGRERDFGYKDDDRSTRVGDFYRDDDRYGRDTDENFRRGSFKDDDHRGGQASDDHQVGRRNMSFDKEKDHSYEDDDSYAYRNGGRTNDASPNERNLERKLSEQSVDAPPSYESALRNDRDGGVERTAVSNPLTPAAHKASSPESTIQDHHNAIDRVNSSTIGTDDNSFDEFDPRGFMPAANLVPPTTSSATLAASGSDIDLFANSSSFDPVNSLALVLSSPIANNETEVVTSNSPFGTNFVALSSASIALSQPSEDPFGDAPFKASTVENPPNYHQKPVPLASTAPLPPTSSSTPVAEPVPLNLDPSVGFDSLGGLAFLPTVPNGSQTFPNQALPVPELSLPQPTNVAMGALLGPSNVPITSAAYGHSSFPMGPISAVSLQESQPVGSTNFQTPNSAFLPQLIPSTPQLAPSPMQPVHPTVQMNVPAAPLNYPQQTGLSSLATQQATNPVSGSSNAKQSNERFETKSTVWADTLNRGLVNLNISGPKTNPLADIGVDFDSINRMERRKEKEKSSANPLSSTVSMGKAMGSGSGIARTGGGVLSQPARPAVGAGMGMMGGGTAMGMGMVGPGGMGMGMGGYGGGINQPMGMGGAVRPPAGMQSTPGFPGAPYNSMTGMGGYGSQQPFGGGYR